MTSIFKQLFFDKELVNTIKSTELNSDHLYNKLNAGKITLKEYLQATSEKKA